MMTTKLKTRKAPAKPSTVDKALARVKAAQAAYDAASDHSDETLIPLSEAESDMRRSCRGGSDICSRGRFGYLAWKAMRSRSPLRHILRGGSPHDKDA
jgi:hypothetical protein